MKSRWFLVLVEFSFWLNTGHGAAFGQDVCNCQPSIIRTPKISVPTPVGYRVVCTKTPGAQQFTPISNVCSSCVNTRVTPATVARVDYDLTATTPSPATVAGEDPPQPFGERGGAFFPAVASACDAAAESAGPGGYPVSQDPPGPDGIDEPAAAGDGCGCGAGPPPAVAADPVSLMLAQAEANRCRGDVREGRLTFGPAAVPKDAVPPPVAAPDVDEEGLYALDKAVVELKTCKRHGQAGTALASDTDALLALEEDAQLADEAAAAGPAVPLPSYADVGYGPETPSCAPLVAGVSVPAAVNPRPTVVYDATACAAPPPPTTYAAEYSPRYCTGCGGGGGKMTSSRYQCSCDECCSCGKSAGGVYSCRKSSY